jgi:hypothetical protein
MEAIWNKGSLITLTLMITIAGSDLVFMPFYKELVEGWSFDLFHSPNDSIINTPNVVVCNNEKF